MSKIHLHKIFYTTADYKNAAPHPRHFDRSEAEWRNLLPLIVRAALRRELSRLRTSWERFLSAPIPTHTSARDDGGDKRPSRHFDRSGAEWRNLTPLMTEKPARTLSSFRPKRSGVEKSPPSDGTGSITVGDLSTQSIIGAVTVCPIPTRSPARDDGGGGHPYRHFDRSEAEWRNLLSLIVRAALRRKISRLGVS